MAAARLVVPEPPHSAREAGLRYVDDATLCIRRVRNGRGFRYVDAEGVAVTDPATLERIRALVIPPAWTDVRISADADGHLQATGRDARGRKQYRYHARWREVRDGSKFARTAAFGRALPRIRRRVRRDLALPGHPKQKVLAAVVWLLEHTGARVGNASYARDNGSFGLTTLHDRHADVGGGSIRLRFRGKSGKEHEHDVHDPRVARIVARCQAIPGQVLFRYVTEDGASRVTSDDVNAYLREAAGDAFTAKDFRTWRGTLFAARALAKAPAPASATAAKRAVAAAIREVADLLGNTPAVCRRAYVHPTVIEAYTTGRLPEKVDEKALIRLLETPQTGGKRSST